jgi:hypothetical protein
MLFLSGQVSGALAAENAYDSRDLCDHDADCEGRTAGGFEPLLINTSADLALVATALLGKLRSQMTAEQGNTVDALKKACPGYAVMRSLVMSFRTILRTGKIKTLHAWMKKADASGLYRNAAFCAHVEAGPECSRGSRRTELEQWTGGRWKDTSIG